MTPHTQVTDQQPGLVDAVVANVLQPNNHELLRHLGEVLGISAASKVLLILEADEQVQQPLRAALDGDVQLYQGELLQLPYADAQFDNAILAIPVSKHLHAMAGELSRVLKPNGNLGMVVFSVYRDQMPDDERLFQQVMPLVAMSRPAAAYRAVLAECGFTAFVSEDCRRDVRRLARDNYRHLLRNRSGEPNAPNDTIAEALSLLATGGIGLTLITAEKSF